MPKHKFSLVACARWEEAAILEWLDYHKAIGFDHVYLWSNDDDPAVLREAVAPHLSGADPFLTFGHWPARGMQGQIYEQFLENFAHETEWFCFLDIDEFLVLKGIDHIGTFMQPLEPKFGCIYFNWVNYGPNGRVRREPGSVLLGHTRRSKTVDFHTKNLIRSSFVTIDAIRAGNSAGALPYFHFWHDYKLPGLRIGDATGEEIVEYTTDFPHAAHAFCHRPGYQDRILETAYCAHFQFKSGEDFVRRVERGSNPREERWKRMFLEGRHLEMLAAHDEVEDTYLAEYWAPSLRMLEAVRRAQQAARQAGEI